MLKIKVLSTCFIIILTVIGFMPGFAAAQVPTQSTQEMPVPADFTDPLVVADIQIDRTANNAVVARDEAIIEAQRQAFLKLAERNMDPATFATFKLPDDKIVMQMVQDFEIRNEQLGRDRYAALFNVRFREGIRHYIPVPQPVARPDIAAQNPYTPEAVLENSSGEAVSFSAEEPAYRFGKGIVLVLPYLEMPGGRTLLWEEPNLWRHSWLEGNAKSPDTPDAPQFIVPLGDISDVTTGSSDAVWSGNYKVIEKLQENYRAQSVLLALAKKSGSDIGVDLYVYQDGTLSRLGAIPPVAREAVSEKELYGVIRADTLRFLQASSLSAAPETPPQIPQVLTDEGFQNAPVSDAAISSALPLQNAGGIVVEATMNFSSFSAWMEAQKRFSAIVPAVDVGITSISKTSARFTLRFPGSFDMLKKVLIDNGLQIGLPAVQVDTSVLEGAARAQTNIYDVQLVN